MATMRYSPPSALLSVFIIALSGSLFQGLMQTPKAFVEKA